MELIALRLFDRVATTGSFTEAAHHYRLAVSTVSRQIGALEQEVGQRLLFRHTRAVSLTDIGRSYHRQVREILARLDLATEAVMSQDGPPSGLLRLNAPVAFGRLHVTPWLCEFQREQPLIQVELTLSDAYSDPVQSSTDITFRVGELADSSLVARTLATTRYLLCASPAYLREHGRPTHPDQLRDHNCLVFKGVRGLQQWYFRQGEAEPWQAREVSGSFYCNDADSLVAAGLQDRGLMLFPSWLLYRDLRAGRLVPVLDGWQSSIEPRLPAIHLIFPENRLRSPKVEAFVAFLRHRVGTPAYWDCSSEQD